MDKRAYCPFAGAECRGPICTFWCDAQSKCLLAAAAGKFLQVDQDRQEYRRARRAKAGGERDE